MSASRMPCRHPVLVPACPAHSTFARDPRPVANTESRHHQHDMTTSLEALGPQPWPAASRVDDATSGRCHAPGMPTFATPSLRDAMSSSGVGAGLPGPRQLCTSPASLRQHEITTLPTRYDDIVRSPGLKALTVETSLRGLNVQESGWILADPPQARPAAVRRPGRASGARKPQGNPKETQGKGRTT